MWRRQVRQKFNDVSEEHSAYIFRVEEEDFFIGKIWNLWTSHGVSSTQKMIVWILRLWQQWLWWLLSSTGLHGVTSMKTVISVLIVWEPQIAHKIFYYKREPKLGVKPVEDWKRWGHPELTSEMRWAFTILVGKLEACKRYIIQIIDTEECYRAVLLLNWTGSSQWLSPLSQHGASRYVTQPQPPYVRSLEGFLGSPHSSFPPPIIALSNECFIVTCSL